MLAALNTASKACQRAASLGRSGNDFLGEQGGGRGSPENSAVCRWKRGANACSVLLAREQHARQTFQTWLHSGRSTVLLHQTKQKVMGPIGAAFVLRRET